MPNKSNSATGQEWEKLLKAAENEAQVTVQSTSTRPTEQFSKAYPRIKLVTSVGAGGPEIYVNGMTTGYNVFYKAKALDPIPPLLVLPEVIDTPKWWQGKHHYVDPENQHLLNINGETRIVFAYNTKLVNPAEIKSYWDMLDPKWKGKIVAYDPTLGGSGDAMRFFYHQKEPGAGFHQAGSHRNRSGDQHRYPPDGRLAGWRAESSRCLFSRRSHAWIWT